MANVIQQKFGTLAPASDALAKGELAIRFVAANHTAASSSKLYFGEGDSANLRQFGFGITDGSTQSGVAIGENLTFSAGTGLDVSVSGQTVQFAQDLSEFADMTADVDGTQDELILLDNGAERRKRIDEINLSAFNNDAGFVTSGVSLANDGNNRVVTATGSGGINGEAKLTFDGTDLVIGNSDSAGISIKDADGTETVRLQTASGDEGLLYLRGPTGGNAIYFDGNSDSYFTSDIHFGATSAASEKVTVTGNVLINSTGELRLGDSGTKIYQSADGQLDIDSDDEIEMNATTIDMNAAVDVSGNLTIGGDIVATGSITADVGGDITLDVDGEDIRFSDGGTQFGRIKNSSSHLVVESSILDKNIIFKGNDGGSTITALTLDMSANGVAQFNDTVQVGDNLRFMTDAAEIQLGANAEITLAHIHDTGLRLTDSGGSPTLQLHDANEAVSSDGTNLILTSGGTAFKVPTSDGSSGQFLKTDGSGNLSFASASSGGIALTDLSVGSEGSASGDGGISYNNSSGVFTYTPPVHDSLSGFVSNEHIDHSGVSITAGDGLTGGGTIASTRTLNVVGGDGITANANDIAVTAANTNLTSIINDGFTKLGRNATQEYITFATDNEINTFINNTERLSVTASGVDITGALTVSGSYNLASGDIPNNAADTSGNAATATALATARTIAGVSFDGTSNISLNNNAITNGAGYTTNTGDIEGVTAGTGLSGGGTSGTVTLNVETTQTINTLNSTGFLLDSSGDITLDAAGEDIIFKDAGSERVRFNIGSGCVTDITGDYHLNGSGSVKIDAATDITLEAAGDDIIFTDGGDERFRFNLDGTPDMVGTGNTAYRATGDLTLDTDSGAIIFNDAGVTRISFDISDASPEMDVTGDFTIDGTGDITLDCAASSEIIITENGGTYTPTADNHVATKKYVDDNAGGGGGGSGTVNSGTATSFAQYASAGTTLSDTVTSTGSITNDLSGGTPEFMIYREDSTTTGNNGLGRIEMGNTDFSSNRSAPNIMLQGQSGGVSQAAGSEGGCALLFKTIINGSSTLQNSFKIHSDGTLQDSSGSILMNEAGPFSSGGTLLIQAQGNGTCDFNLAGSDERIKHEIDTYEYGLKEIEMLNPKYFKYNKEGYDKLGITGISDDGNKNHFGIKRSGFIAQDIEKAMPEGVVYEHDDGIKSYHREGVIAALVNAVKELSARVKELEGEK